MAEYIERESAYKDFEKCNSENPKWTPSRVKTLIARQKAADVAPVQKWISVEDRLPEPEQEVIVCCESQISKYKYVCCAFHIPENWYRESSKFNWFYDSCDEYDEEQDDYVVNKGWYESIHNWDEYSTIGIDDAVTHWMPIPEPPKEK